MSTDRVVPESWRKLYDKCLNVKASPRSAIKMACGECVQYIREEITLCTDKNCPLYGYRPFRNVKAPPTGTVLT
jgi:hypothetical protein